MRILLRTLGVLLILMLVGAAVVYFLSESKRGQLYTAPVAALALPASGQAQAEARGAYLASILGCRDCHGENLAGKLMMDAPPFRVEAPNLTSGAGGVGAHYDAEQWDQAVRHAIGQDGRGLYVMPSAAYRNLSDADMAALVAYLESLPPVEGHHEGVTFKPVGRALLALGLVRPEVVTEAVAVPSAPAPGTDASYGRYLASLTCTHCHGADLAGAPSLKPGGLDAPSLRPVAQWTPAQFAHAIQNGLTPDDRRLDPMEMPWTAFAAMTEADVTALYNYVRELAGLETIGADEASGQPNAE